MVNPNPAYTPDQTDPFADEMPEPRPIVMVPILTEQEAFDAMLASQGDDSEMTDAALVNAAAWAGGMFGF